MRMRQFSIVHVFLIFDLDLLSSQAFIVSLFNTMDQESDTLGTPSDASFDSSSCTYEEKVTK